jgi:hypothetical protein
MGLGIKARILLLVGIGAFASTLSCAPETKTSPPKSAAGGAQQQGEAKQVQLTREGIIETAWREARQRGYDRDNSDATYDSGNAAWRHMEARMAEVARSVGESALPPMFQGHEYQVVYFHHRDPTLGGLLYVFVDINTGKVIGSVVGQ